MNLITVLLIIVTVCLLVVGTWLAFNPPQCQVQPSPHKKKSFALPMYEGPGNRKLYYFHQRDCGACREFRPQWAELVSQLRERNVSAIPIDARDTEHSALVSYYGVTRTPTFILVVDGRSTEFLHTPDVVRLVQFCVA